MQAKVLWRKVIISSGLQFYINAFKSTNSNETSLQTRLSCNYFLVWFRSEGLFTGKVYTRLQFKIKTWQGKIVYCFMSANIGLYSGSAVLLAGCIIKERKERKGRSQQPGLGWKEASREDPESGTFHLGLSIIPGSKSAVFVLFANTMWGSFTRPLTQPSTSNQFTGGRGSLSSQKGQGSQFYSGFGCPEKQQHTSRLSFHLVDVCKQWKCQPGIFLTQGRIALLRPVWVNLKTTVNTIFLRVSPSARIHSPPLFLHLFKHPRLASVGRILLTHTRRLLFPQNIQRVGLWRSSIIHRSGFILSMVR